MGGLGVVPQAAIFFCLRDGVRVAGAGLLDASFCFKLRQACDAF
jgi:hypothetical protein